nr:phytoene/squalene synthase family protein [Vagococcus penaei]
MTNNTAKLFRKYTTDFDYCERVIKKYSKTFYAAFSQLPTEKSKSVYAVYAFCRKADDLVDESDDPTLLENFKNELTNFNNGVVLDDPIWRALSVVFEVFPMDITPFYDMLTGQEKDLDFKQPNTLADLGEYSYYVAGSVGLMLLPILSAVPNNIKGYAKKLGEAMQLTNILRDVGEDFKMGRIYLPKDEMKHYQVTESILANGVPTESFIQLWEHLACYSEKLYQESLKMIPDINSDCQLSLLTALFFYQEQLNAIRQNHYAVFEQKIG